MKKSISKYIISTLCIYAVMVLQMQSFAIPQKKGFVISGNIEGLKDGSMVCLVSHTNDTLSKAISRGSRFILKGQIANETAFCFLSLDTSLLRELKQEKHSNTLWLVNGRMQLTGKLTDFKNLVLKGSEVQTDWIEYKQLQDKFFENSPWPMIPEVQEYISNHRNSLFAPIILRAQPPAVQNDAYLKLSKRVQQSAAGKDLAKLVERNKSVERFASMNKIPDFKLSGKNGDSISIHALISSHRYTLIDFWASWCGPCRAAFPRLEQVYKNFSDKGFNIVGISLDENKADWLEALEKEKTPWFQGFDNLDVASKNIFGLTAVPGYLLIDREGKIVQSQLRSFVNKEQIQTFKGKHLIENLQEMLEEILK